MNNDDGDSENRSERADFLVRITRANFLVINQQAGKGSRWNDSGFRIILGETANLSLISSPVSTHMY